MKSHHQVLIIGKGTAGIMVAAQLRRQAGIKNVAMPEPANTHCY